MNHSDGGPRATTRTTPTPARDRCRGSARALFVSLASPAGPATKPRGIRVGLGEFDTEPARGQSPGRPNSILSWSDELRLARHFRWERTSCRGWRPSDVLAKSSLRRRPVPGGCPLYSSTKPATRSKSDKASPAPGGRVGTVGLLNKQVVTDPEIDAECI